MTDSNPNIKHLVLVLDRSGSMHRIAGDTTGGVASLLADQIDAANRSETPLAVVVTLAQFDDKYELAYDRKPIGIVNWSCNPRGATALHDAVGKTITTVREADHKAAPADRPGHTVLVIVTDGYENSSVEYDRDRTRELIEQVQADGWEVLFLGAGLDAWSVSDSLGVSRKMSASYSHDSYGTQAAFAATSGLTANSRAGGQSLGFTDEDREAMTRTGDGQPETD